MADDRPAWARRMYNERKARGWSQADAVSAMRAHYSKAHSDKALPSAASLLRQYKRWEAGEVEPDKGKAEPFYKPIIAEMFGTVTHAMFPVAPRRDADADVLAVSGMDTLELVSRLQRSDMDQATLDGLRIMADRLCSEYPFMPSDQLLVEGRSWLRRVVSFRGQLTLSQHREILTLGGWIALLIACVEYDSGDRQGAETTRRGALSLGTEADQAEIKAWAHEIRAWIDLTTGNYHGVVAAARAGTEAAPHHSVAIQLAAQEAKAWARIGDRRATEVALDRGRRLLEAMPYPDNLDNHFVVDPTKYDFYMMDCYRHLAEDRLAETLATEVIQASTDFDGTERAPMRLAEARITLGVVAARQGDLEQAIHYGERALCAPRKSLPSLLMVSRDLTRVLNDQYPNEPETQAYLDQLHALSSLTASPAVGS
jgi:tetratricopeptide (TPR) repeat protein